MNKKIIQTILIFLLIAIPLSAQEKNKNDNEDKRKLNFLYLRRNSAIYNATEYDMFISRFPLTNINQTSSFNYNSFGYQRFFENSKMSLEANYYENKKTNMQTQSLDFTANGNFYVRFGNLGTYYRSETNFLFQYQIIDNRLSVNAGLQQIKSNLSDSSTYYFNYDFAQNFKGPTTGINYETPHFLGFFLTLGLKYSLLYGNLNYNYSLVENSRLIDYALYKDSVIAKYYLKEYRLALGYEINDSTILSIGVTEQFARISEDNSNLQGYSIQETYWIRTLFNTFVQYESFYTSFVSIMGKF